MDVKRFGLIYASAQKNIGLAGMAVVIVREDLIGQTLPGTPSTFDYRRQADNGSMVNTPPTYAWYIAGLMLEWLKEQGGLVAIEARNIRKANKLYSAIDASPFYSNPVEPTVRSRMNVPFHLPDTLEKQFLADAKDGWAGLSRGAPFRGRIASQHLQRHARRGRGNFDLVHARIREKMGLIRCSM